jgi:hypothetical protein
MVDTVSNYLTAALALAGEAAEALATMRAVLAHASAGGGVQSIGNTVRNGIVLFERLGLTEAAAVLAGWLGAQRVTIPGTAGMRAHAAGVVERVALTLGPDAFAVARARGAAMSVAELVALLAASLEHAESNPPTKAAPNGAAGLSPR